MNISSIAIKALILMMMHTVVHAAEMPSWRLVKSPFPVDDTFVAPFSVKDFGAKGDGVADDTPAFKAALSRTAEIGGGSLYVPAGRYVIRGRITIPTSVTLRGIWKRPTAEDATVAGTVLMLYAGRGEPDGPAAIGLEKCSGIRELTIWYPEQAPVDIIPYPFAIAQLGGNNATVENVTLVNAYQGIQVGPAWNELHLIRHVYGTPLKIGIWYDFTTDIGRLHQIYFSPDYWSGSGLPGAPAVDGPHAEWILKNGTGIHMKRSDWEYGSFVRIERYGTGMMISKGDRGTPNAQFYGFEFIGCRTGLRIFNSNPIGLVFTRCTFRGGERAIHLEPSFTHKVLLNNCRIEAKESVKHEGTGTISFQSCHLADGPIRVERGVFAVADCTGNPSFICDKELRAGVLVANRFVGPPRVEGSGAAKVQIDPHPLTFHELPAYPEVTEPMRFPTRQQLFVVPTTGRTDSTPAIQQALTKAESKGGGTVFLPAGDYVVRGHLDIPTGVELKGVYDVPHHTIGGGSVLHIYGGRGKAGERPTVLLHEGSGLSGLSFHYPEQNPTNIVPYPYLIGGMGKDIYIVNVNCANPYQFLDMYSHRCDNHFLDYLSGAPLMVGIRIGGGSIGGTVKNTQFNPHYWNRTPRGEFYKNHPTGGMKAGTGKALWNYQKENLDAMVFGHCVNEVQLQNFVFGSLYGIHFIQENGGASEGGFILGHGTDGSKVSAFFEATADGGLVLVNTELVCMASRDKEYIILGDQVRGAVVLHNTMLWGHPDRSGTLRKGILVLQQGTFLRHGDGFHLQGGELSLFSIDYNQRRNHVTLKKGTVKLAGNSFAGPLIVNGEPLAGEVPPGVEKRGNIHR